jgi:radical SAM superfamily enzyme YgiQ (UPF0313 family)
VAISLVIGYPTETPEQLLQTIDFIYKTKPDYVYMCEAVPYPGTELYDYAKSLGLELAKDWSPAFIYPTKSKATSTAKSWHAAH